MSGTLGAKDFSRQYVAPFVDRRVNLSGKIDDPLWELAPWSEDFVDILGDAGPRPRFRTRTKMLWSAECLTIAAELEEPHVWATVTERDAVIFHDNDFEVFIDPDGDGHLYGEFEINALNTAWDLLLVRPYRAHGPAMDSWDIKGLRTAVHVEGTLNDPSDTDKRWTVEIEFPWTSLSELAGRKLPPKEGDAFRINFSRVQWRHEVVGGKYRKVPNTPEDNWVWSPQGVVDMHRPEKWGWLHFSRAEIIPPSEPGVLFRVYEEQLRYRRQHGSWVGSELELGLDPIPGLHIEFTRTFLELTLGEWMLDHEAKLTQRTQVQN